MRINAPFIASVPASSQPENVQPAPSHDTQRADGSKAFTPITAPFITSVTLAKTFGRIGYMFGGPALALLGGSVGAVGGAIVGIQFGAKMLFDDLTGGGGERR